MAEENTSTMNLDLNLGPVDNSSDDSGEPPSGSYPNVTMNLEDWLDDPVQRVREVVRNRNHRWRSLWRQLPIPTETRNLARELIGGDLPHIGEGSVASDERPADVANKACENCTGYVEEDALECPVCKGEVTVKNVTPIYGRGNNHTKEPEIDSSLKIPIRPAARRVESWRQAIQRTAFTIPMEEMIRRLGSTFDLSRELSQIQNRNSDNPRESPERSNTLLNRILTSRAIRRERGPPPPDDVIDLTDVGPTNYETRDNNNNNNNNRRLSSMLLRRSNSHRAASLSNLASAINSAESLAAVESYFHINPVERNQELPPPFDDRDSLSSIAAVIHSESQTVDNAIEIDSTVSLSTSSSRRRNDPSRVSDVDSGDSRAPRRRRLN
ncbi:hypothetical protein MIMGU_mgv1a008183mg [Erythranthe guttata]|uniref:E3 ubiquitin-protein ligase RMA n=1 Tax=Erythranthe guttata TaxID=4155 RepID=A0A022PWD2_ERYGU|nr:hypothetical protein MIMGU_mgv1a008183mg [Erythranthe guttata]